MTAFATLAAPEQAAAYATVTGQTGIATVILEKDFWVCWLLGKIFATPALGDDCVFKGGTSLSKVFGAIDRFSEDVDLGLSPASLGWNESDLDDAPSATQRLKRMKKVEADCASAVQACFLPELVAVVRAGLGERANRGDWLVYTNDAAAHSPVVRFHYPSVLAGGTGYIERAVQLEFGSLTDQRPTGTHPIAPLIAGLAPDAFTDFRAEVVALEIERTFWEKATILHAEYHRPPKQPIRDRFARHYADFAALWNHPGGRAAASRLDLLERVRIHKSRFFGSAWGNYEAAIPGTLRLTPPNSRVAELRRDYAAMEPMFLSPPPSFDAVLDTLRDAERTINRP
ncbi:MAG: nucleotidyl transferase AbiEii/AbiGii toxin family protein [Acidobacteria bacterium]|nr:nucleotidyl transferase AbiEii/AbiGii toxin family protein [Acidobacteriota bacterium]